MAQAIREPQDPGLDLDVWKVSTAGKTTRASRYPHSVKGGPMWVV
jgi:hypothetical protein